MGKKSPKRSPSKATSKRPSPKTRKPTVKKAPAKTPEDPEILTGQAAAGKYWGVTPKTIQAWISNGMPANQSGRRYTFDIAVCDPWVKAFRSQNEDGESQKLNEQLKIAKLQEQVLKNEKLEREKQIAEGNLVRLDEYELFAAECVIEARDQLLTIPREMKRHLCKKCQKKTEEIKKLVEQALQRLGAIEGGPDKK